MAIGDLIFQLMGKQDPRKALLNSIGQSAQQAVAPAAAQGGQQTPAAYNTPPDLMKLYGDLIERQDRNASIDSGLGLIAATFAHPENKQAILNAAGADGSGGGGVGGIGGRSGSFDPLSMMKTIQEMKDTQEAAQTRATMREKLPALAKQYGMSEEAVQMLFENGQLDEVISEAQKPNKQIIKNEDGTSTIVDIKTGTFSQPYGPKKARETEIVEDPVTKQKIMVYKDDGTKVRDLTGKAPRETEIVEDRGTGKNIVVYKDTKEPIMTIGGAKAPATEVVKREDGSSFLLNKDNGEVMAELTKPGNKATPDMVEWQASNQERAQQGLSPISLRDWIVEMKKAGATKEVIDKGEEEASKEGAKTKIKDLYDNYGKAKSAVTSIGKARQVVNLVQSPNYAGDVTSPTYLEGAKVLSSYLGIGDTEKITNTEQLRSALSEQVLPRVKELGAGTSISNADVNFTNNMVGNIATDPMAIQNIALVMEKGGINEAIEYNERIRSEIEKRTKRNPNFDPSNLPDQVEVPQASPELRSLIIANNDIPMEAVKALKDNPSPERIKQFDEMYGDGSRVARILLGVYQ